MSRREPDTDCDECGGVFVHADDCSQGRRALRDDDDDDDDDQEAEPEEEAEARTLRNFLRGRKL